MEKIKGAIIASDHRIHKTLPDVLRPVVEVVGKFSGYGEAYRAIKELLPHAVFIEAKGGDLTWPEFVAKLRRQMPRAMLFLIGNKDPDLILKGMRSGVNDVLPYPYSDEEEVLSIVREAVKRFSKEEGKGEVLGVFSLKGGQGITSIATNLADHICRLTGDNTLLLDLNLFMSDVALFVNLAPQYTIFDMVRDLDRMDEDLLFSSLARHNRGFYLLCGSEKIGDAEDVAADDIARMFGVFKQYMDYTIVDLPHDLSERTLSAIESVDVLLLVAQQSLPVLRSLQRTLELFDEIRFGRERVRIVLNRYLRGSDISDDDVSRILDFPVSYKIRNDYRTMCGAINSGKTLDMSKSGTKINMDMEAIAASITRVGRGRAEAHGLKKVVRSIFG